LSGWITKKLRVSDKEPGDQKKTNLRVVERNDRYRRGWRGRTKNSRDTSLGRACLRSERHEQKGGGLLKKRWSQRARCAWRLVTGGGGRRRTIKKYRGVKGSQGGALISILGPDYYGGSAGPQNAGRKEGLREKKGFQVLKAATNLQEQNNVRLRRITRRGKSGVEYC